MSGRLQRGHQGPLSLHSNDFRSCGAAALHKRIAMSPMRNVRTARPAARSACADRRARRRAPDRARPHARRAGAASAAFHKSSRVALAAVKFFLGQDEAAGGASDDEDDDPEERVAGPTKAELYAAHKKARRWD